ncbi:unnamed protein product [Citrullus colocynthis]|uniref:Uncharacterized protein n=1 Tax=Citrullus colocynthis TaxID=252529 RepID=A0ABP0Y4H7_9ROSI
MVETLVVHKVHAGNTIRAGNTQSDVLGGSKYVNHTVEGSRRCRFRWRGFSLVSCHDSLLFVKAKFFEAQEIARILDVFEKAFGQVIN